MLNKLLIVVLIATLFVISAFALYYRDTLRRCIDKLRIAEEVQQNSQLERERQYMVQPEL